MNSPATIEAPSWADFAAAVSGEWEGVTATFDRDGEAQPLPEYYVPQVNEGSRDPSITSIFPPPLPSKRALHKPPCQPSPQHAGVP